jgi:hypothetical protein
MRNLLLVVLMLTTASLAALLVVIPLPPEISTLEIDKDRDAVKAQITEADAEAAKYTGGAIKTFIDLRIAILRNTLAMLDQKRASYIRLVKLNYTVDGHAVSEASETALRDNMDELSQIERKAADSKKEASKYSGGLVQAMSLMKAATEEATASTLRMKFYSAKYGIPILVPSLNTETAPVSDAALREIMEELTQVERKAADAKKEASKYTGGLVQGLSLMKAATEELTASTLRMKFYSAKYGIPVLVPSLKTEAAPAPAKPGTVVKDRDAL